MCDVSHSEQQQGSGASLAGEEAQTRGGVCARGGHQQQEAEARLVRVLQPSLPLAGPLGYPDMP